jgi:hypothetical protein
MKPAVFLAAVIGIIVLAIYLYSSSGWFKQRVAKYTGYSEICVDGVEYIQFISGASVKYNTNGTISLCK